MADPLAHAETDEVLSSVRRLVAAERRPEPRAEVMEDRLGRLLLTPDLLVMEAADAVFHDGGGSGNSAEPRYSPDGAMDRAAMQALVAEIVREELRGALGEKITRNVRRLVRQEINRALAERNIT